MKNLTTALIAVAFFAFACKDSAPESVVQQPPSQCTTNNDCASHGANWTCVSGTCTAPSTTFDFGITAAPPSQSVGQSGSTAFIVTTSVTGTPQDVALTISNLPAGMTAVFTPPSIKAGGSAVVVLSTNGTAPNTYTLTVGGAAGALSRTATVAVTVTGTTSAPNNDFTVVVNPTAASIGQGASATVAITTSVASGSVASTVQFTVVGLPPGMTQSIDHPQVTTGGSATLTINVGTVAAAVYPLTVMAATTNPANTHLATINVTVTGGGTGPGTFDFSLAAVPTSQTIGQSGSVDTTITTTVVNGSGQQIAYSVTGMPNGMTAVFNTPSVAAGNPVVLTVGTPSPVVPNLYNLTVTGTSGALSRSVVVPFTVTATVTPSNNDFSVTASPANLTLAPGSSSTVAISTATATGSTASIVQFTVVGQSNGPTGTLSAPSVTTGGSINLIVNVAATVPAGVYTLALTAQNGSKAHSATVVVTVPPGNSSGGSLNGASCSAGSQCVSGICTLGICIGKPNGVACDSYRECASNNCSAGFCQAIGGNASTFKVTLNPSTLNLQSGNPGAVGVQVDNVVAGADVQQVTLSAAAVGGITATFTPNPVNTGKSTVMYIDVPVGTPSGSYTVNVIGTSGSLNNTASLVVTVGAIITSTDDFSFVADVPDFTLTAGVVMEQDVAVSVLRGGNPLDINLTLGGVPTGMIAMLSTGTTRSGGNFSVTIRPGQAVPGVYKLIISGTGNNNVVHTKVLTATIVPATSGGGGSGGTSGAVGTTCSDGSQCSSGQCANSVCIDTGGSALCALPNSATTMQCYIGNLGNAAQPVAASTLYCCPVEATALVSTTAGITGSCLGAVTGQFRPLRNVPGCAR